MASVGVQQLDAHAQQLDAYAYHQPLVLVRNANSSASIHVVVSYLILFNTYIFESITSTSFIRYVFVIIVVTSLLERFNFFIVK